MTALSLNVLLVALVKVAVIYGGLLGVAAGMTLAERKFSAWMQFRVGPNRVGPWGLLQPLADGVKFIFKEELLPRGANKLLFRIAPMLAAVPAMMMIAVIPFAGEVAIPSLGTYTLPLLGDVELGGLTTTLSITDLDVSVLYVLAVGGLSIYGVILGGWASNSKFSLLGSLRASAQMISYELTLMLSLMSVVLLAGSLDLRQIVESQSSVTDWYIWSQPLAFLLFVVSTFAETNRHPFDFAECEPELVGGFHTEYSSMKFALFFLGEYCAMTVMACLSVTFFLGGYSVPFLPDAPWWLELVAFCAKTSFFLFLFIWVRWTLPRFRFDQLMGLSWKVLLNLALANLFVTGLLMAMGVL
ncbi:MAG TPA: NADH-quinone oxidoreductase subunit NuoH [Planctomycetota bacterium]|nr:NADH-quinone oxidoreductase subunit NuoH [Planctomycetota bacterium]